MSLFAIGDLHLPGGDDKPMSVFGPHWDRHFSRISEAWREMVGEDDTVLIPGDISWAMQLEHARSDLEELGRLPGKKVLIKGNHDYWWNSVTQVRANLPKGMIALQHDAADVGEAVVCGTRGWSVPDRDGQLGEDDRKIYQREVARLALALDAADRIKGDRPVVVMLHYPPLYADVPSSGFTDLMESRGVRMCVYGHLHGNGIASAFRGECRGVVYTLTSCDSLDFRPVSLNFGIKY